ncbi:TonB-dependent receptor [Porticoccus sp. W117]|uniref:TonB-dependent receptor n=1 Tax=Porticoccus sp. W117 TaxID=3054777 RepID=UPI0025954460|nr:TonB-dependent receptor [Porticoccus sp. W117]MDM3870194.1 TonB-dependent receptor [Porticoccus sp. W117]
MKHPQTLLSTTIALLSTALWADDHIEEIVVSDSQKNHGQLLADIARRTAADSAQLLRTLPGANVNSIGTLSGIAQYRGLSGERVAVQLDGAPVFSGGPNAMDAPLSYAPSLLLKQLSVTRGIAPVTAGQESVGGQIEAQLDRGTFADSEAFSGSAKLSSQYQSVNNGNSSALQAQLANRNHKLALLTSYDNGNNSEFAGGTLAGTQFERNRYDLSYGYRNGDIDALFYVGKNNTDDTGTPALPMDINFIDTDLAGFDITASIGDWKINSYASYSDVSHGMDNFSQRQAPPSPMMFRSIDVQADHLAFGVNATTKNRHGQWQLGFDTSRSDQDSDIFNPNNSAFLLRNFNDIERDIDGLFAQWSTEASAWKLQTGVRYNQIDASAGEVAGVAVPPPVVALANGFNSSNRDLSFSYVDLVAKANYTLDSHRSIEIGIGRKHRAPSYQELFLWVPLPITGGLADGRSYVGNLQLRKERNDEATLGFSWQTENGYFTPQLFYRRVDDYIQGTAATNAMVNMVSMALSGAPALQYNNVDAELYGIDAGYGFAINQHWRLNGSLSYVQGKRRDGVADNLYRLAPLNHRVALNYQKQQLGLSIESLLYAAQNDVAQFNNEQATGGYGLINISASYDLTDSLVLSGGIGNLLDKHYRDHLAGYNRNGNSDVAVGERLPGAGRSLYLAVELAL